MRHSKITFLMTAHNSERFIRRTIECILDQTEPDITLVIRNNASSDSTGEICREIAKADGRVVYLENKENWVTDEGESYKSRKWWPELHSDYVSIVDHDDILHQDFARAMYKAARLIKAQIAACGRAYFDDNTEQLHGEFSPPNIVSKNPRELAAHFPNFYTPVCRTLWGKLYRTDFFEKYYDEVRDFPPGLEMSSDTWIVLGYMERCRLFVSVDCPLYFYRTGENSSYFSAVPALTRIGEADILYEKGKHYLEKQRIDTVKNLAYLDHLYMGHLNELMGIVMESQAMPPEDKIKYLQQILAERKFQEHDKDLFAKEFLVISQCLRKILPDCNTADSGLWRYYLVRIWDGITRPETDPLAFLMLLSGVFDRENGGRYGFPLIRNFKGRKSEGEAAFADGLAGDGGSSAGGEPSAENMEEALEVIYGGSDMEKVDKLEADLFEAVETEDYQSAADLLEQLTNLLPEGVYTSYARVYLSCLIGERDAAVKYACAARIMFADEQAIQELCSEVIKNSETSVREV